MMKHHTVSKGDERSLLLVWKDSNGFDDRNVRRYKYYCYLTATARSWNPRGTPSLASQPWEKRPPDTQ